ncbi:MULTISPECIES: VOC family protein [Streptomyces]|uniref:VOC family protein n=1 Tax=Streptomyces tsukubensis (strain DSM 42081 / NBRC 108919 / NRRL 18488 / 9993) TaxID=1114943 RepID=I2MVM6_STRT9|nr:MULTISPECIES: VOC family protein [Streptomyces]AZK93279.1 bleomycin resistance protein [Streptomyces tsukubensis]EIF88823.1 glyoxalase/bleomycin resistance protein/dioxygenase superfamily protein [Streptomyces tsukubensis NRRL18488]MYS63001.1 VOC family protein [Streptomyces sp. SID5473]QKM70566.1 VOC family protein [Streptomyces tsukubensis NRRL18488]TAI40582.1 VOC family protein [Streptomyces tsukubensis]
MSDHTTDSSVQSAWPARLASVGAVRFARPTAAYDEVVAFYGDGLGLPVIAEWRDHEGYDGVVFGLPGTGVQLEITQHGTPPGPGGPGGTPTPWIPAPHPENQLVLYLDGAAARDEAAAGLRARGHVPVPPANPYWARYGAVLFEDPDGWLVVLAPWVYGRNPPGPTG